LHLVIVIPQKSIFTYIFLANCNKKDFTDLFQSRKSGDLKRLPVTCSLCGLGSFINNRVL